MPRSNAPPEAPLVRTIGPALRRIRHTLGWSQSRASTETGIPKERISRYENGQVVPSLGVLERFAVGFGTTVSDIAAVAEDESGSAG